MFRKTPIYLATLLLMAGCSSNKFLNQRYTTFKKGSRNNAQPAVAVHHLKTRNIPQTATQNNVVKEVIPELNLVAEAPIAKMPQSTVPISQKQALQSTHNTISKQIEFKPIADKKENKKEQKKFIFGLINSVLGLVLTILIIILVVALILVLV
jgi:hypothetical protein